MPVVIKSWGAFLLGAVVSSTGFAAITRSQPTLPTHHAGTLTRPALLPGPPAQTTVSRVAITAVTAAAAPLRSAALPLHIAAAAPSSAAPTVIAASILAPSPAGPAPASGQKPVVSLPRKDAGEFARSLRAELQGSVATVPASSATPSTAHGKSDAAEAAASPAASAAPTPVPLWKSEWNGGGEETARPSLTPVSLTQALPAPGASLPAGPRKTE